MFVERGAGAQLQRVSLALTGQHLLLVEVPRFSEVRLLGRLRGQNDCENRNDGQNPPTHTGHCSANSVPEYQKPQTETTVSARPTPDPDFQPGRPAQSDIKRPIKRSFLPTAAGTARKAVSRGSDVKQRSHFTVMRKQVDTWGERGQKLRVLGERFARRRCFAARGKEKMIFPLQLG
jgi:hypothetical protein